MERHQILYSSIKVKADCATCLPCLDAGIATLMKTNSEMGPSVGKTVGKAAIYLLIRLVRKSQAFHLRPVLIQL